MKTNSKIQKLLKKAVITENDLRGIFLCELTNDELHIIFDKSVDYAEVLISNEFETRNNNF